MGLVFPYETQSSAKRQTDDLIINKNKNRIGPKSDSWGTPDRTGTGSQALVLRA